MRAGHSAVFIAGLLATAAVAWGAWARAQAPEPATQAPSRAFWDHWGDGRGELNGYRLVQPRYGAKRTGYTKSRLSVTMLCGRFVSACFW